MAKITFKGLDGYLARMTALEKATEGIVSAVIYDGAEIVANEVRDGLQRLPVAEHDGKPWFGTPGHLAYGPSREQKQGLIESFGITPISTDSEGFTNVHIGFDGYNSIKSAQWPQGQPNQMVARAVESGTSFMEANPVFKIRVRAARPRAQRAMKKRGEKEIQKNWNQSPMFTGKKSWEK